MEQVKKLLEEILAELKIANARTAKLESFSAQKSSQADELMAMVMKTLQGAGNGQ